MVQAARTNEAQLYGSFGNQDGLFAAVMADLAERITSSVPIDADDLAPSRPEGRLTHPDASRRSAWGRSGA